ncbi:MAG: glycosyltransferase [Pseudonocardiaceae bacterium]
MRVLVVCIPQAGHLTPVLPLASALAEQGDEVVVASGPEVADTVTAAGLRFAAAGRGPAQWFPALAKRIRGVPGDGLPAARILPYLSPRLFGEIAATDMIDEVSRRRAGAGRATCRARPGGLRAGRPRTRAPGSGADRHDARTR